MHKGRGVRTGSSETRLSIEIAAQGCDDFGMVRHPGARHPAILLDTQDNVGPVEPFGIDFRHQDLDYGLLEMKDIGRKRQTLIDRDRRHVIAATNREDVPVIVTQ